MKLSSAYSMLIGFLTFVGNLVQPVLLFLLRLWWGWSFFLTGKGKLENLDRTAAFFNDLHIPMAKLNATVAGSVECIGGLLLLVGLGSRIVAIPLMFTLTIAYATAERDALFAIFSDTDKFTGATPFLFLLAVVIVFAFGPGAISLDALLGWWQRRKPKKNAGAETPLATSVH